MVDDVCRQATATGFATTRFQHTFQDHAIVLVVLRFATTNFMETMNAAAAIAAPASTGIAGNRHTAIAR
jgi:hypothetical protein